VGRNVLVISTVEHADDLLRAHVGEADTTKVVVPAYGRACSTWLANDQEAFGHAERVAVRTAERLTGETVDAGLWANPTVPQDRGYGVTSALALVVEAVEALHLPLRL
jgi:hypothetical protein